MYGLINDVIRNGDEMLTENNPENITNNVTSTINYSVFLLSYRLKYNCLPITTCIFNFTYFLIKDIDIYATSKKVV